MEKLPFEYLKIDTDKELKDKKIKIEGEGIIVLTAPIKSYVKINSRLADPVPLVSIERLNLKIKELYITSPQDIVPIELLIIKDPYLDVDANSQYSMAAKTGTFLSYIILSGARRGNYSETYEIDYTHPQTIISKPYVVGPYVVDNIISITLLSPGDGWQLTLNSSPPKTGEILTSTYDLTGLQEGDKIEHIALQGIFIPNGATQNLKVEVSYLYVPIWG